MDENKIDEAIAELNARVPGVDDESDLPYEMLAGAALAEAARVIEKVGEQLDRSLISQRVRKRLDILCSKLRESRAAQDAAVAARPSSANHTGR